MAAVNLFTARKKKKGRISTNSKILKDTTNKNKSVFSISCSHKFTNMRQLFFFYCKKKFDKKITASKIKKIYAAYFNHIHVHKHT